MASDVTIRFGADASELQAALDDLKAKLDQSAQAFNQDGTAVAGADHQLAQIADTARSSGTSLQQVSSNARAVDVNLFQFDNGGLIDFYGRMAKQMMEKD